jgi:cysteine synthase A
VAKTVLLVGDGPRRPVVSERASQLGISVARSANDAFDGVIATGDTGSLNEAAAIGDARGLPGIGVATAHVLTHKVALRRRLADAGVPQPRFAAVRMLSERRRAVSEVGFPAVLKPANAGGQRGVFRIDSLDDVDAHLHESLSASPTGEAILEELVHGTEMIQIAVVRDGHFIPLTLSDRRQEGFGVASAHVYPAAIYGVALEETERIALRALSAVGLRNGVAFVELVATTDGRIVVVGCAPIGLGGQLADLVRIATGVNTIDVELLLAVGEPLPDELVRPQLTQSLAIRFLTADPGPLPAGRVKRVGPLDKVLAFPGVVAAVLDVHAGETIHPVRIAADRRGYVIAVADTNLDALGRAEAAARLVEIEIL